MRDERSHPMVEALDMTPSHLAIPFLGAAASLLVCVLVLTGAAVAPAGVPDACALVTRAEAAAALGKPVPVAVRKSTSWVVDGRSFPADYCYYGSEVLVARVQLGPNAVALFTGYRNSLAARDDYGTVAGVGDEAFTAKGQLAVRRGAEGLIVDVGQARGGGPTEPAAERQLAQLALRRF
jgi:hypothetical protein